MKIKCKGKGVCMATYQVGKYDDFVAIFYAMQAGDTIIIERDVQIALDQPLVITQDVTIRGYCRVEGDQKYFDSVFQGNIVVNGANLVIDTMWLEPNPSEFMLSVINQGMITMTNSRIAPDYPSDKNGIIVSSGSTLHMDDTGFIGEHINAAEIIINDNSTFNGSHFNCRNMLIFNSEVTMEEAEIFGFDGISVSINYSTFTSTDSDIYGFGTANNQPTMYIFQSTVQVATTLIAQSGYPQAVLMETNSNFTANSAVISSIDCMGSRLMLNSTHVAENLTVQSMSYVKMQNLIGQPATMNSVTQLVLTSDSILVADGLSFDAIATPNVDIDDTSVAMIAQYQLDSKSDADVSKVTFDVAPGGVLQLGPADGSSGTGKPANVIAAPAQAKRPALAQLEDLDGLASVKAEIERMINFEKMNTMRVAKGLVKLPQVLHSVFMGNPGTGKTTVARLMGQALYENGALAGDKFIFVEADESDLVSEYVGDTKLKTKRVLDSARGGVLFIDEAYTLNKKASDNNFGQEAIDTILKYMEDHRDDIMIIFAGYTTEMEQFLQTNPGLESRVPNKLHFEDYTADVIVKIGEKFLAQQDLVLEDAAYYARQVVIAYNRSLERSNVRWIRTFNEQLTKVLSTRLVKENDSDVNTIKNIDIDTLLGKDKYDANSSQQVDALAELDDLVGIASVKAQVRRFINVTVLNKRREQLGDVTSEMTLHSLFLGNPGTGKTTVARLLGQVLYQKDIIKTDKFIEVSRSDLVAAYTGQTAIKTREVLTSALGGVLFIDEAYSLCRGDNDAFGLEAIDEILKFMEDHRADIVIIFAGYTKEMQAFLRSNSGLASRIPNSFEFADYAVSELAQMGVLQLQKQQRTFNTAAYADIVAKTYNAVLVLGASHDNGRWIRNFNDKVLSFTATRLADAPDGVDLNGVTDADIQAGAADLLAETMRTAQG